MEYYFYIKFYNPNETFPPIKIMVNKEILYHEDVFIKLIPDALNIGKKNHFDYNPRWIWNYSRTKRVVERIFKAYPLNIVRFIKFHMKDANGNLVKMGQAYSLIRNQLISDLQNHNTKFINDIMTLLYQGQIIRVCEI